MNCAQHLKRLDILGKNFELTFRGDNRSKTWFGAMLTLLLSVILLAAVIIFGLELISYEEPIVHSSQSFSLESKILQTDLPIMFSLVTTHGDFITEEKILNSIELTADMSILSMTEEGKPNFFYKHLSVEPCSDENLSPEHLKIYQEVYSGHSHYCVNPNFYLEPDSSKVPFDNYFKNNYGYIDSAYISFSLRTCDEQVNPGCLEPLKKLGSIYVNKIMLISYFDFNNYSNPIQPYSRNFTTLISPELYSRNFSLLRINSIFTDKGWIFKDQSKETFFTIERDYQFIKVYDPKDRYLASFYYEVSFIQIEHFRRYVKLQELLANIGGFMKACLLICEWLVYYYSEYAFFVLFKDTVIDKKQVKQLRTSHLGNSEVSYSNIPVRSALKKRNISFCEYMLAIFSKTKDVKMGIHTEKYLKYLDIGFISESLIKLEEKAEKITEEQRDVNGEEFRLN